MSSNKYRFITLTALNCFLLKLIQLELVLASWLKTNDFYLKIIEWNYKIQAYDPSYIPEV